MNKIVNMLLSVNTRMKKVVADSASMVRNNSLLSTILADSIVP